ncbi:MAG: NAD(P)/FAD-dependent oxidoreductase [Candidatus Marinimicrobia bacterium]|nr:NAD(P)/FAD-dependent oxidoreductase [Candidatus Neomarinimicrobiota bacterium]MCF7828620.1 NAD(P)/FAD-dependent oxidoreductase [Candidatus Neomarinimicrobiota bacterium]MCF7880361.1 NAD(P)/FAD-dependent oxidoreductase [Candidatus Neomarinimicrobiota bacterium]
MNNSNGQIYDIIIVGAGPAGTTAALYAKRKGLTTLLLDRASFPRDKICGDALSGKSVTILEELDLIDKVSELPGAFIQSVVFGSPTNTRAKIDFKRNVVENTPSGFVIRREIFDNFLFQEAKQVATDVRQNFLVKDVIEDNGRLVGVRGKDTESGEEFEFHGKIVFGADGFNSLVARKTGLYDHDPEHWVVALRQYYKGVKGLTDQIELHYVDEVLPGYFWIFPLEDDYANIGIGMLHKYIKDQDVDLKVALRHAIESEAFRERFGDAEPMEDPRGWNLPVGSKHRKIFGNGFMLLGDAASLIDPFTGEGIGNALYSAKYAVEVAEEAISANDFTEDFIAQYDQRLWTEVGDELRVSHKLQKLGRFRPLLNFVINKASNSEEVSNIIAGMLANEVPRKQLANPLFYFKLLFS